jgi:hypothetical protein
MCLTFDEILAEHTDSVTSPGPAIHKWTHTETPFAPVLMLTSKFAMEKLNMGKLGQGRGEVTRAGATTHPPVTRVPNAVAHSCSRDWAPPGSKIR